MPVELRRLDVGKGSDSTRGVKKLRHRGPAGIGAGSNARLWSTAVFALDRCSCSVAWRWWLVAGLRKTGFGMRVFEDW